MYKVLKIYDVALKFRHVSRDGQNTSKHVFSIQNTYFENTFQNTKYIYIYHMYIYIENVLTIFFYFIQCEAWGKVLESVSRQAPLQRALRQRLRNPWTQLKSHIVGFN